MKALLILLLLLAAVPAVLAVVTWFGVRQIRAQVPPVGKFVTVHGQRLHYVDAGQATDLPPIVLLHGASSNLRDFTSSILPTLAEHTRVLAFDRPGLGYSPPPETWQNPAELASLFLDAAAQLGAQRPLIVGHSWSGSIVMACVLDRPGEIAGGALIAGATGHWAGGVDTTTELAAVPVIGPLFAHTFVYPVGSVVMPRAVRKILRPNPPPADYVDKIGARLALRPRQFMANAHDLTRLSEFLQLQSARYADVTAPLLILHGTADDVVPYWNHGQRVAAVVPHAQVDLLEDVGHAPHHVVPEAVVQRLLAFARAPDAPRPAAGILQPAADIPLP